MSDLSATLGALHLHPIKSCGAMALNEALLTETGLDLDRAWMVVDADGEMLTQRELPRMALIQPSFKLGDLVLRAPGALALHVRLDAVEKPTRVRVWADEVKAYDMGDLAAQWFSVVLGSACRLVRFDPEQQRLSSARWTQELQAENAFSDGFPILVTSAASLDDLNRRLALLGHGAVTMARFRPNIVLAGVEPYDEDHLHELEIETEQGPVVLRLVKPCVRCTIPNVDPITAETAPAVGDTLAGYRADARMNGGITFGMNAVIVQGLGHTLRVGQRVSGRLAF